MYDGETSTADMVLASQTSADTVAGTKKGRTAKVKNRHSERSDDLVLVRDAELIFQSLKSKQLVRATHSSLNPLVEFTLSNILLNLVGNYESFIDSTRLALVDLCFGIDISRGGCASPRPCCPLPDQPRTGAASQYASSAD